MTDSVVERLARAIGRVRVGVTGGLQDYLPSDRLYARAALDAIEEPTEAMLEAGYAESLDLKARFKAMIRRAKED